MIDFHTHIGTAPDAALTADELLAAMDRFGVERAVVFPINERRSGPQYSALHDRIARAAERWPGRLVGFARIVPSDPPSARAELERMSSLGLRGVKLHPLSDAFNPPEAAFVLDFAAERGLPVIVHTAHNPGCTPAEWEPLAAERPSLTLVFAHSGRSLIEEAVEVALRCPNVLFDTSINIWFNLRYAASRLPASRFLFGSDLPYAHLELELHKLRLIWSGADLRAVLHDNAAAILGDD